jgi:hypothetical protein
MKEKGWLSEGFYVVVKEAALTVIVMADITIQYLPRTRLVL